MTKTLLGASEPDENDPYETYRNEYKRLMTKQASALRKASKFLGRK